MHRASPDRTPGPVSQPRLWQLGVTCQGLCRLAGNYGTMAEAPELQLEGFASTSAPLDLIFSLFGIPKMADQLIRCSPGGSQLSPEARITRETTAGLFKSIEHLHP
jgi:hypothetical protein